MLKNATCTSSLKCLGLYNNTVRRRAQVPTLLEAAKVVAFIVLFFRCDKPDLVVYYLVVCYVIVV